MELLINYTDQEKKKIEKNVKTLRKILEKVEKGQVNNVLHVDFKKGLLKKVS